MRLLALDTATDACSCALWVAGEVHEAHVIAPRRHAELLLPAVERVLGEGGLTLADLGRLDAIAFGRGPGSFTGLRIACGVVQGLAFGADLPVVPVSTLHALAEGARRERGVQRALAGFDARMGEVYWGAFAVGANDALVADGDERVCAPTAVPVPASSGWTGVGDAWRRHGPALRDRLGGTVVAFDAGRYPRARDVAALGVRLAGTGAAVSPEAALPSYLRDRVAAVAGRPAVGGASE